MKKLVFSFVALCAFALTLVGCGGKQLKEARAKVTSLEISGDTLKSMRATVDGDTLLFKLADARFTNGIAMRGDSIVVHYIKGRKDTLRALVIGVMPQAPHYFDPEKAANDTLVTAKPKVKNDTNE